MSTYIISKQIKKLQCRQRKNSNAGTSFLGACI